MSPGSAFFMWVKLVTAVVKPVADLSQAVSLLAGKVKKKSAEDVLEQLQKDIDKIEHNLQYASQRQKVIIGKLLVYSIVTYLLAAAISYFYLFPSTWKGRALICVPLFGIPLLIFYAKQFVGWLYKRDITKSKDKLADLLSRKKKTLEDVMNTETYKKAKEILDKYAPEPTAKPLTFIQPQPRTPIQTKPQQTPVSSALVKTSSGQPYPQRRSLSPQQSPMLLPRQQAPRVLIRPIFPPDRGMFDRFIENIIGDGPNNRYALICKNCSTHNGMALKEEFEYLAFKCVYCGFLNPSRKVRPRPSLGGGQFPRRGPLYPGRPDGSPSRQAIEDAGSSSDNESGVKIEEVTDEPTPLPADPLPERESVSKEHTEQPEEKSPHEPSSETPEQAQTEKTEAKSEGAAGGDVSE